MKKKCFFMKNFTPEIFIKLEIPVIVLIISPWWMINISLGLYLEIQTSSTPIVLNKSKNVKFFTNIYQFKPLFTLILTLLNDINQY